MKISIITAVYNGATTIAATLRSVAAQDYASIEHIVIDGASTDETVQRVRSQGTRVARLISEPDSGVYDAFNKGLRCATGDVIAFLNCGDTYESSGVVSRIAQKFADPERDAVFADLLIVDAEDSSRVVRRYSSRRFSPQLLAYGVMPAHPTLFLRNSVYQSVGEYDGRFRIAGDYELCLRVFALPSIRYCYVPHAIVRMPSGGLSNRGWRSTWDITREMRRACEANGVRTNFAKLLSRLPLKVLEMI